MFHNYSTISRAPSRRSRREHASLLPIVGTEHYAVHARVETHRFARHAHAHHVVVLVEAGALTFSYRGTEHVAEAGQIALLSAMEPHTGRPATADGCTYWALAIDPAAVARAAGGDAAAFQLRDAVVDDRVLACLLVRLRQAMAREVASATTAELDARLHDVVARLASRHVARRATTRTERAMVRRARAHLDAHYRTPISLATLGATLGHSPSYVARAFQADVGMSPHVYVEMCRVRAACAHIEAGERLSAVAYLAGFPDQAHFTRRFKAVVGLTPGAFARGVRRAAGTSRRPSDHHTSRNPRGVR